MLVRSMEQEFSLPFQKVLLGVLSQVKYVFQSRSSLCSFGFPAPHVGHLTCWYAECTEPLLLQSCSCLLVAVAGTFISLEVG